MPTHFGNEPAQLVGLSLFSQTLWLSKALLPACAVCWAVCPSRDTNPREHGHVLCPRLPGSGTVQRIGCSPTGDGELAFPPCFLNLKLPWHIVGVEAWFVFLLLL